ncbi:MAG: T9SS type A sorting domain-containing protein [Bacteroidia bacterium]|nr:T9SS type A sorting domain-containing protein [Bacteroidia bacterium]
MVDFNGDGLGAIGVDNALFTFDTAAREIGSARWLNMGSPLVAMVFVDRSTLLLSTEERVYKADTSGVLLDSSSYIGGIQGAVLQGDNVLLQTDKSILRMDTGLIVRDTLLQASKEFKKIKLIDATVFIIEADTNQVVLHEQTNSSWNTIMYQNPGGNVTDVHRTQSEFIFTGNSYSGQMMAFAQPWRTRPIERPSPNVQLKQAQLRRIATDEFQVGSFTAEGEFAIKNVGLDTLHSVAIFCNLGHLAWCQNAIYYEVLDSLNLAPGDEATFESKTRFMGIKRGPILDLCFEALAPNGKLEVDLDSNRFCGTYVIVGNNDLVSPRLHKVYPNPTSGHCTLEFESREERVIEVFNSYGSIVKFLTSSNARVGVELNQPGHYFIRIIENGMVGYAKVEVF